MGQSSSRRRSFTPGKSRNTEVALPPLENGGGANGSIEIHQKNDTRFIEGEEPSTSALPNSVTRTSSSTSSGKAEKRKRFRLGFPLRRTPSGRWSRKRKTQSQNGTRPVPVSNLLKEEQQDSTDRPQSLHVQQHDTNEDGNNIETVDFTYNVEECTAESKSGSQPESKSQEKAKGKRNSQKTSSKKKKNEKENSKKDKKKKKQSSREDTNVTKRKEVAEDLVMRELVACETIDKDAENLHEAEVEKLTSFTPHQQPDVDTESSTSAVDMVAVSNGQEQLQTESFNVNASPTELPAEHIDSTFAPESTSTDSDDKVLLKIGTEEMVLERQEAAAKISDGNDEEVMGATHEAIGKQTVEIFMQPELQVFVSDKDVPDEYVNVPVSDEINYESIFITPVTGQTAEACAPRNEAEIEMNQFVTSRYSSPINHDGIYETYTATPFRDQSTDDKTFRPSHSLDLGANGDVNHLDTSAESPVSLFETKLQERLPELDTSGHMMSKTTLQVETVNMLQSTTGEFFPFKTEDTEQMKNEVTEQMTTEVTEQMKTEVTEQMTTEVTEPKTIEVTEQMETEATCFSSLATDQVTDHFSESRTDASEQMKADTSFENAVGKNPIHYEEVNMKVSRETDSNVIAKKTVELVVSAAMDVVKGDEYEVVEVKVVKTMREEKIVSDIPGSDSENDIRMMSKNDFTSILENEDEKLEKITLEVEQLDKHHGEEDIKETGRKTVEERNNKEQSTGEKLMKIPKKLSNWFHKMERQPKSFDSVEVETYCPSDKKSGSDLNELKQDSAVLKQEQVMEATLYPVEQASAEFTPSNSHIPDKTNLTLHIKMESPVGVTPTQSSLDSDTESSQSTSLSPTSPTSYSGTLTSPSSDGEGSSHLKKISLGSRLRTAILRKRSSGASETGQGENRVSLTRPKSIGSTDLTALSRKLYPRTPVDQFMPITEGAHDAGFPIDTTLHTPFGTEDSTTETTVQSKSVASTISVNDSGFEDITSPVVESEALCTRITDHAEEIVKEADNISVSCAPVIESLTDNSPGTKEKSYTPIDPISDDQDGDTYPILDLSLNNDEHSTSEPELVINSYETALSKLEGGVNIDKTALSDPEVELSIEQTALCDPVVKLTIDKNALSQPEIGISSDSTALPESKVATDIHKSALHESEVGISSDKSGLSKPEVGISSDKAGLSEPEVGTINSSFGLPLESSRPLFTELNVINSSSTVTTDQTQLQETPPVTVNQMADSIATFDTNDPVDNEVPAHSDITYLATSSETSCTSVTTASELSSVSSSTSAPSPSSISEENKFASVQQNPVEISVTSDDTHQSLGQRSQDTDVCAKQEITLPEVIQSNSEDQNFTGVSKEKDMRSKDQMKMPLQKQDPLRVRTIAEYPIGIPSGHELGQTELWVDDYQTSISGETATSGKAKDHRDVSDLKETAAEPYLHQRHAEETCDGKLDNFSTDKPQTSEEMIENDPSLTGQEEKQITILASQDENKDDYTEDTTHKQQNKNDEFTSQHVSWCHNGLDNLIDSENIADVHKGEVFSGISKTLNGTAADTHHDVVNGIEETNGDTSHCYHSSKKNCKDSSDGSKIGTDDTIEAYFRLQFPNNDSYMKEGRRHLSSSITEEIKEDNSTNVSAKSDGDGTDC